MPTAPEILAQTDGPAILQSLFNIGFAWTKNYEHPEFSQFVVAPGEVLDYRWPSRDRIVLLRKGQQWPAEPHIEWEHLHGGLYPRIELRGVEVKDYTDWDFGTAEVVDPGNGVAVSAVYTVLPGQTAKLGITSSFQNSKNLVEASKLAIEAEAKVRFGSFNTPVGAELTTKITDELSRSSAAGEIDTLSIDAEQTYVNNHDYPVRLHVDGTRRVQKEVRHCQARAEFDYEVRFYPLQRLTDDYYHVDTKGLFVSAMKGLEPSDIGAYTAGGQPSLADRARSAPNVGFAFPLSEQILPWTVEYNRSIDDDIHYWEEPLGAGPDTPNPSVSLGDDA